MIPGLGYFMTAIAAHFSDIQLKACQNLEPDKWVEANLPLPNLGGVHNPANNLQLEGIFLRKYCLH